MNTRFKFVLILSFFALLSFNSCQDEITEVTDPSEETLIVPNSTLANLMQFTVTNDGAVDDIMDDSNCFSVNLPVTIIVNGITLTINSLEDLAIIEEIFEQFDTDEDVLDFIFPITIILNDYEEIVIQNVDQLEDFIAECINAEEEIIECIDFQYPISFSIYNTDFQIIGTEIIGSDEELFEFLENLQSANDETLLASLNFPVTMKYADGSTVEVNNNAELEAAINEAEDDCYGEEEEYECSEQEVDAYLTECHWNIVSFNGDDNFIDYDLYFGADGTLEIINSETNATATVNWSTSMSDQGVILNLSQLPMFDDDLGGDWYVYECDDDRFKFTREAGTINSYIIIERECEDESDCNVAEIQADLKECKWYIGSNLVNANGPLVFTDDGVKVNGNVIGGWNLSVYQNYIYLTLDLYGDYTNISKEWKLVECDEYYLQFTSGDYILAMEQDCNNSNSIGCLESNDIVLCDDDNDGFEVFNLYQGLSDIENCTIDGAVSVSYHTSLADAENDTYELTGVTSYTNVSSPQTIYVRIEVFNNPSQFEVLEIGLILEDCTTGDCSEQELDSYLMEQDCYWVAVNVSGSNAFDDFKFYFNANQDLTITNGSDTILGVWSTSGNSNDGVYLIISQLENNFSIFNGEWLVVECSADRIVLSDGNEEIVIERECP